MAARVIVLVFMLSGIVLNGCKKKDDGCSSPETVVHYIGDTSAHWFENTTNVNILYASSSKGRSESYYVGSFRNTQSIGNFSECTSDIGEHRFINYQSSLYDHVFYFQVGVYTHGEFFTLSRYLGVYYHFTISTSNTNECVVTYQTGNDKVFPITTLDTMLIGSRVFKKVFKIDFMEKATSLDKTIKVIYFTSRDGLIRFEQFDGEVWSLY